MLDRKTTAVMAYINRMTEDGGYKVVEADDIVRDLHATEPVDRDTLRQIVVYLKEREFISVKYAADDEYCLTSLPKGRSFVETKEELRKENRKKSRARGVTPFVAAFLGAFLGCALALALYLLLF